MRHFVQRLHWILSPSGIGSEQGCLCVNSAEHEGAPVVTLVLLRVLPQPLQQAVERRCLHELLVDRYVGLPHARKALIKASVDVSVHHSYSNRCPRRGTVARHAPRCCLGNAENHDPESDRRLVIVLKTSIVAPQQDARVRAQPLEVGGVRGIAAHQQHGWHLFKDVS